MQLDRLGVQAGVPVGDKGAFVLSSKPYFQEEKGLGWDRQSPIKINEDGVENTYYFPGAAMRDDGRTIRYTPPHRFYLMKTPTTDYSKKENFYMPSLLGKTISVDIDLKRHGPSCGCYLTFYLVGMPSAHPGYYEDYYCDSRAYKGMGVCSEFQLAEGNKNALRTANHACTASYSQHPNWKCNKNGDPLRKTTAGEFGIGVDHSIDSSRPFHYAQSFDLQGDDLTVTTVVTQDDRRVEFTMGPGSSELNAMVSELRGGMALVTGYWYQEDMEGLDSEACGNGAQECNMRPAYVSNWTITTNGATPAPTPAPPAQRRRRGQCCWGHDCTACEENHGSGWKDTQGYCRGGHDKWSSGHLWNCVGYKHLDHDKCRAACASNPECMAYDRPHKGDHGAECCLFKGGVTGDGRSGRHCYLRTELPSTHPIRCSESASNCWQCSGAWCDARTTGKGSNSTHP